MLLYCFQSSHDVVHVPSVWTACSTLNSLAVQRVGVTPGASRCDIVGGSSWSVGSPTCPMLWYCFKPNHDVVHVPSIWIACSTLSSLAVPRVGVTPGESRWDIVGGSSWSVGSPTCPMLWYCFKSNHDVVHVPSFWIACSTLSSLRYKEWASYLVKAGVI